MSIIPLLAISLGRRDEGPNIELAEQIASANNKAAVEELATALHTGSKKMASDCIKVLYEVADRKPELVAPHLDVLLKLLTSKDNRLVWGAMTAIHGITSVVPNKVHKHLNEIMLAADAGSVITKDHAVGVLTTLAADKKYQEEAIALLLAQLENAAGNQLGMYAEQIAVVLPATYKDAFINILNIRIPSLEKDSQKSRINKLLKKLQKN
ncbi:MAG: hypothetical protein EOP51_02540 [Sphingobacteriales bacterium]|nr:MAG: hypothetical protein EOP51_02540 [Sphingobacteriales bacterium]